MECLWLGRHSVSELKGSLHSDGPNIYLVLCSHQSWGLTITLNTCCCMVFFQKRCVPALSVWRLLSRLLRINTQHYLARELWRNKMGYEAENFAINTWPQTVKQLARIVFLPDQHWRPIYLERVGLKSSVFIPESVILSSSLLPTV